VIQAAGLLAYSTDNVIIAQVLGPAAVSEYSVVMRLFGVVPLFLATMLTPLWPAYGESMARGDVLWMRRTLDRSMKLSLLVASSVSVLLVVFGREIIHLWVGPHLTPAPLLLIGFGFWTVVSMAGATLASFLNGASIIGFQVKTAIVMSAVAVVAKILLAREAGLPGVIWALVGAYTLFSIAPSLLYVPRLLARIHGRANTAAGA
jgi:O-antigen/teichoic acid export membrane protein